MSKLVNLSEQGKEAKKPDTKFTVKEVGYLLQLVENTKHNGQALELALICKIKLQSKLENLTKYKD
jgi:hypothetical protein